MKKLLANGNFRRLWFADIASLLGDWLNMVAVYSAVVMVFPGGLPVALLMLSKSLPSALVSPWAGKLSERYDLRQVMLAADLARIPLPFLLLIGLKTESLTTVLVAESVMALFSGIYSPARAAAVPRLLSGAARVKANAVLSGTWSATFALGAALGGVLTHLLGLELALTLDAASYLGSALVLVGLKPLPGRVRSASPREKEQPLLLVLRTRPALRNALLLRSLLSLTGGATLALPFLGNGLYDQSGVFYVGLLYAARGFGFVLGSVAAGSWLGRSRVNLRCWIRRGFLLLGLAYLGTGLSSSFWGAGFGFLVAASGVSLVWVAGETLVQNEIGDSVISGRLYAFQAGAWTLTMAMASLTAGLVMDLGLSPQNLVSLSGLLGITLAALHRTPPGLRESR